MATYHLGVDIGGTKSHALIADETGRVVGSGLAGAGSYEVVGWDGMAAALREVVGAALVSAGIGPDEIAGAGYGIAGYDWPGEREPHDAAIRALGLGGSYRLVNDSMIGLVAGAEQGWGLAVVSGTGANCWGRNRAGRLGHTTGGAEMLGEYGGADTIVPGAIRAVSRAYTKRSPETALTGVLVTLAGAKDAGDLLEGLYMGRYKIGTDAAPAIFQIAAAGDTVANQLIAWAGRELGSLCVGVTRQLGLENEAFEVVQIGSLFGVSALLTTEMMATLHEVAPGARATRLTVPPVIGGVILGMEAAGLTDSESIHRLRRFEQQNIRISE
ncbi:MAG: ATPase [Anaerolineae bacterium]|nr:ATPase [Anaerolineae bacterium]